ncbi:MAG: DUF4280 domain-containing protein [Lachnospiraceae bacterium]|nr:DUF4280 domain-containing protein [Lachnospiraceae bacterium]
MGEENKVYVCRLAKAKCDKGTMSNYLNVKIDHGIVWEKSCDPGKTNDDKQPFMNACDYKEGDNVVHFGRCNSDTNPGNKVDLEEIVIGAAAAPLVMAKELLGCGGCKCKPILTDVWENVDKTHLIGGVPALTQESTLYCRNGGTITIMTQEEIEAEAKK